MIPLQNNLLTCAVCHQQLNSPITLSCGFTICKTCLPLDTEQTTFICPVQQCTKQTHLFGPNLLVDQVIQDFIVKDQSTSTITQLLTCPIGQHCLEHPITTHCGHTFCKLCLLQYKISNDACNVCQKRLPNYQFIQQQAPNHLLSTILSSYQAHNSYISSSNHISNNSISFLSNNALYSNIPIHLTEFPVLPTQKLWIPIYTEPQRQFFLQSLLLCKEYQCLCFAILKKDKANHKNQYGTLVKINSIKQRPNDVMIQVTGLDRFQVNSVNQETDDFIRADITTKYECPKEMFIDTTPLGDPVSLPPSPTLSIKSIINTTAIPPSSPPADYHSDTKRLANTIHEFVDVLSRTAPSNAFCSTVEGLLGPVWLESVQNKHGEIPSPDNPIALCWWTAIVLPVGAAERNQVLQTESLVLRLKMVLSWINDLKSTWIQCRQTAVNSALRAGI